MYRNRSRDKEIEEFVDGEIMEWDLEYLGWESSELLDPKQDHHDHDHDNHVLLDFTNSTEANMTTIKPDHDVNSTAVRASSSDSSGGASKRVNVDSSGAQRMSCSVDGCSADLSGCRDYHKRHRVCERHSKTPIVVVKGEEKRFCQQCSRFHSLGEFDDVKRSCRKRLDGHNRRRRKSLPEPLFFSPKNMLSGYKGSRMLHFDNPQISAAASVRTLWPSETKTKSESWLYSPHHNNGFQFTSQAISPQTWLKKDTRSLNWQPNSADQFGERNDHHNITIMMTTTTTTMSSSSDEEVPLPIDSGGRALYLLSTNSTQPTEPVSFQCRDDRAVPYHFPTSYSAIANKTFISGYNINHGGVYDLRMGPDSMLELE